MCSMHARLANGNARRAVEKKITFTVFQYVKGSRYYGYKFICIRVLYCLQVYKYGLSVPQ